MTNELWVYPDTNNDDLPIRIIWVNKEHGISLTEAIQLRNQLTSAIEIYYSSKWVELKVRIDEQKGQVK